MLTRLLLSATAIAMLAGTVPATAQTAQDDARFRTAQDRFDREYDLYRQEVDRYVAARGRTGYNSGGPYRTAPAYPNGYAPAPSGYDQPAGYAVADDRYENGYDPARYYRPAQQDYVLRNDDRVYAGNDGRYYCKRSDGTTGLIIGGAAGGILGNVIDGGHSRILGTLLGGAAGALAGKSIEQNTQVRCR